MHRSGLRFLVILPAIVAALNSVRVGNGIVGTPDLAAMLGAWGVCATN